MASFSNDDSLVFKEKLYENFKDNGLLARLQTTLRTSLLEKIQKPGQIQSEKQKHEAREKSKPFHLRHKFIQSIFNEYLQTKNMQYTKSIFLPQGQLEERDCLSAHEIAEITNFSYKENHLQQDSLSFLEQLIDEWVRLRSSERRERAIQTQEQPVSKKLESIERSYLNKMDYWKLMPNRQPTENNPTLEEYGSKLKAKFQIEKERLKLDTERIVRAQMEKKFQDQYAFRLNQITKQHQKRIDELKLREKEVLKSLEKKKEEVQKKSKELSARELQLIQKYERRQNQIQLYYKGKQNQIEKREKQFWKKQLELKAKKRQYEDTIRLVKQKAIGQAGQMPLAQSNSHNSANTFYN